MFPTMGIKIYYTETNFTFQNTEISLNLSPEVIKYWNI